MPRKSTICDPKVRSIKSLVNNDPPVTAARSALMAKVRPKDSRPEKLVRSIAHKLGYRFRLHRRDLPGTPDLVFPKHRSVVFVHGCFWHRHKGCRRTTHPKTRAHYWRNKFSQNVERDARNARLLRKQGWRILVLWECQTFTPLIVRRKLLRFLSPSNIPLSKSLRSSA
jgi:DNA mismatch endonuclease (patch repair protein)